MLQELTLNTSLVALSDIMAIHTLVCSTKTSHTHSWCIPTAGLDNVKVDQPVAGEYNRWSRQYSKVNQQFNHCSRLRQSQGQTASFILKQVITTMSMSTIKIVWPVRLYKQVTIMSRSTFQLDPWSRWNRHSVMFRVEQPARSTPPIQTVTMSALSGLYVHRAWVVLTER